jgi:hypothetical protein
LKQIVPGTLSRKKPITKIGLVEWLKVNALSSSPGISKKKKKGGNARPDRVIKSSYRTGG